MRWGFRRSTTLWFRSRDKRYNAGVVAGYGFRGGVKPEVVPIAVARSYLCRFFSFLP
jgi:hypothetical protein